MGKSSLVARTIVRLRDEQIGAVAVDLQDSGGLDEETFYLNILDELRRAFQLDVAVEAWWDEDGRLGASLRFRRFFTDHLLPQIDGRVVIFIDEIDTMLTMPFRDNFFAAIRALFNGRSGDPELERLTFVLLGVASPSELIADSSRTPFNIGKKINLREFEPTDAEPLLEGLQKAHSAQAKAILERIFYWTSGHPYLTQQLCLLINQTPDHDWHDAAIDGLVRQTFLSDEARNEDNIKLIQSRISASPNKRQLLGLYKKVYRGKMVKENKASVAQNQLLLSGLVSLTDGQLQVRNQIYRNVFDRSWIQRETEINWGVVIGAAGGVIALLAILALLYNSVWLPSQQRNFELSFLQATSPEERADALAGLASIRPLPFIGDATVYERSVREQFFGMESWQDQKEIYDPDHFKDNPDKLVQIIKIISISMVDADESGRTTQMLVHMANSLGNLEDEDATVLQQEINQWVQGRTLVENNEFVNASEAYTNAITINPNNPATLFERARILTKIGHLFISSDQTISQTVPVDSYNLALADLDRVVSIILLQPEPEAGEILPTSTATLTPTATETAVPTSTATPTIISSPTPVSITSIPESTTGSTPNATTIPTGIAPPTATILPTQPPPPTPTPRPLPPQFNTRSQWLNLIRDFLQSEPALGSVLANTENPENVYPNLLDSGLIETPTNTPVPPTPADTFLLQVQVNSRVDQSPIVNAIVRLDVAGQLFSPEQTDSNGFAVFELPADVSGDPASLTVEGAGFTTRTLNLILEPELSPLEFQIQSDGTNTPMPPNTEATATKLASDEDEDGLTFKQEIALGTNPLASDTDGDLISDGQEVNEFGTDPLTPDTDGDGINDVVEINNGTDPLATPPPAISAPIITQLELLLGDVLSVCWEWDSTLDTNNFFAVRFWPVTEPERRESLVFLNETCYQFLVGNEQFPEGDYFINVAVVERASGDNFIVLVESEALLVTIPNVPANSGPSWA
jgi:hypothetical protein